MAFEVSEQNKQKIIALISVIIPEAKIYLFGSRARGKNAEWSDIDLALDIGHQIAQLSMIEVKDVLEATNLPYKVDVVDMYAISDEMKKLILKDRVIWKS